LKFRLFGTCVTAGKKEVNELAISSSGELFTRTERKTQLTPVFKPFLEETVGNAMNQDVSFGGTPEIIHNGGSSTEWTGSAIQGTWNFADSGKISLASGVDQDSATFAEESPTTIDISGFTAITGKINLTTYNANNNDLDVEFDLAGTLVGNSVNLNDYIETTLLASEQSFAIPKGDMGLASQSVDGFTITLSRAGGPQVAFTMDDIQIEQTGTPLIFKVESLPNEPFHITELRLAFADTLAATVANGTAFGLAHDQILGVSALSTGIVFRRIEDSETVFAVTIKDLGDFLSTGSNLINAISDGTDTFFTLLIEFPEPIILRGPPKANFLAFTINDNLSGLTKFTAAARGAIVTSEV